MHTKGGAGHRGQELQSTICTALVTERIEYEDYIPARQKLAPKMHTNKHATACEMPLFPSLKASKLREGHLRPASLVPKENDESPCREQKIKARIKSCTSAFSRNRKKLAL